MEPQNNQPNGEQTEHANPAEPNVAPSPNAGTPATPSGDALAASSGPGPAAPQQSAPMPLPPAPATPEAPVQDSVVSPSGSESASQPGAVISGGLSPVSHKRSWLLVGVAAVVLALLLGGGYIFAFFLPNQPSSIYATSLKRTGEGLDALVTYSNNASKKGYKSYTLTGTVQSTGTASFDGSLNGSADTSGNASYKLNVDVLGEKLNANIESVHVAGSTTPDIYVQLTGIKKELDSFGLSSLDSVDGKWIAVDHTLINSYTAQLNKQASNLAKGGLIPTREQVNDAVSKVQTVNKQYIFTTDASKAVLANEKFIGKQTKDGRATYHYTVSYDKAHLQAYVSALGTALDSSALNTWAKSTNSGKSLSQTIDIKSLQKSVANAKPGYKFDVWVDAKTKLIHAVSFADPSLPGSVFTLSQNYTGGTTYPFAIHMNGKDSTSGETENAAIDIALDTKTDSYKGAMTVDEGKDVNLTSKFTLTPSKNGVVVKAPAGAEPVMNLLADWGLSGSDF